ncbi:hypothetical protein ACVGVM_27970 (plasmid) [Pseudonocardia bannensis]
MAVDVFETVLRESIDRAQHALQLAQRDEQSLEEHQHAARLLDLLDRARAYDIDTTGWVEPSVLASVPISTGEGA